MLSLKRHGRIGGCSPKVCFEHIYIYVYNTVVLPKKARGAETAFFSCNDYIQLFPT